MPSNDMRSLQIKILTYGIYALMALLTVITGWHSTIIKDLPDHYVRLERYKEDHTVTKTTLGRIEDKLDRLIMSNTKLGN